jgi:hypothetical protein
VEGTLIDSHILPRWAFKNASAPPPGGKRELVRIENNVAKLNLRHFTEYMLCSACEHQFGLREDYMARMVSKPDGRFPALRLAPPLAKTGPDPVSVLDASRLDCDKIAYFGASVLWRAAVSREHPFTLDLGDGGEEDLRRYLLGRAPFPRRYCLLVELLEREEPGLVLDRTLTSPKTIPSHEPGFGLQLFAILGFLFVFFPRQTADRTGLSSHDLLLSRTMLVGGLRSLYLTYVANGLLGAKVDDKLARLRQPPQRT